MTYTPEDFAVTKTGTQFAWLDSRLTLHGFPPIRLLDPLKDRVQRFQVKQGWSGSGADGLVGPKTLLRLTASPTPVPTSHTVQLSKFKRTLPTGEPGHPTELYPLTDTAGPVTFRAPTDGVTTENTWYARDELREMHPKAWSNAEGTHTLAARLAITNLPEIKPHVVCVQIHDDRDDVCMVRLEGGHLFVESPYAPDRTLDTDYRLGSPIDLSIVAQSGGIKVIYNGTRSVSLDGVVGDDWYFKAGCYTQASSRVDPGSTKYGTGYGEVVIYELGVSHATA